MSTERLGWSELPHQSFTYDPHLLSLRWCLECGQAFRWRETPDGWWTGVVEGRALRIRGDGGTFTYAAYPSLPRPDFWHDYLRLDFDLREVYEAFSGDPHLAASFRSWSGMRVMRQDPTETIITFLCTTANSIPRITRAIERMSLRWGEPIAVIDGRAYHAFPRPEVFEEDIVEELAADCNLGYRALNLVRAVREINSRPEGWADSLRRVPYERAREELMSVRGIGPKIADCVALFALSKDEAVPVDTHIRQVTIELYLPEITTKSLTANTYNRISGYYRERFGRYAGWIQQYLFFYHLTRHREVPL